MKQAERLYKGIRSHPTLLYPLARGAARLIVRASAKLKGFELPMDEPYSYYSYVLGLHEPGTTSLVKKLLRPGMIAIDVGAHIGYYTRLFAKIVGRHGRVYAFEPDPTTYMVLARNTRRFLNVYLFNMAALDRKTIISLYKSKRSSHNSIWNNNVGDALIKPVTVPATKIDEILNDVIPHLVKVDVEGAELEVLMGMTKLLERSSSLHVIVECNPSCISGRGSSPNQLIEMLWSFGLEIAAIDEAMGTVEGIKTFYDLDRYLNRGRSYINLLCTR